MLSKSPCASHAALLVRELDNATSAFGYLRERVTDKPLALFALEVTTEANLTRDASASFLFSEQDEERSRVR